MKKIASILLPALFVLCLLSSWGTKGHHAIGLIAQHHLTAQASKSVNELLGTESLADVSTYADEIRPKPEFSYTSPWHYINLPAGSAFDEFATKVKSAPAPNVYTALLKCEQDLADSSKTKSDKVFALKFIVHLVGDLHQPMHVSHAEDKGGNTVHVIFNGKPSNLHRLWDSDLIEHQNRTYEQLAESVDKAGPHRIKKWQRSDVIQWLYESYKISNSLYSDAARDSVVSEHYYKAHRKIVKRRLEMAGIRLAGVLNTAFEKPLVYKN